MALSLQHFPSSPFVASSIRRRNIPTLKSVAPLSVTNRKKNHRFYIIVNATEDEQPPAQNPPPEEDLELSELKNAMMERAKKKDESIWSGVVEEIGQIEWPAFNKVVGTTGVVLGVIAGSSVVLLTVNAVLAELSDQVFAGRGVQDFFG